MNKKFVFDLDGVLRELYCPLEKMYKYKIREWNTLYNGKDVVELIDENLDFLFLAPASKYLKTVLQCLDEIEIWTWQKRSWRSRTMQWIENHIKCKYANVKFLTPKGKIRELNRNKNIYLIEDYPLYKNYDRIILIDRIYNKNVKAKTRITKIQELKKILKEG